MTELAIAVGVLEEEEPRRATGAGYYLAGALFGTYMVFMVWLAWSL